MVEIPREVLIAVDAVPCHVLNRTVVVSIIRFAITTRTDDTPLPHMAANCCDATLTDLINRKPIISHVTTIPMPTTTDN